MTTTPVSFRVYNHTDQYLTIPPNSNINNPTQNYKNLNKTCVLYPNSISDNILLNVSSSNGKSAELYYINSNSITPGTTYDVVYDKSNTISPVTNGTQIIRIKNYNNNETIDSKSLQTYIDLDQDIPEYDTASYCYVLYLFYITDENGDATDTFSGSGDSKAFKVDKSTIGTFIVPYHTGILNYKYITPQLKPDLYKIMYDYYVLTNDIISIKKSYKDFKIYLRDKYYTDNPVHIKAISPIPDGSTGYRYILPDNRDYYKSSGLTTTMENYIDTFNRYKTFIEYLYKKLRYGISDTYYYYNFKDYYNNSSNVLKLFNSTGNAILDFCWNDSLDVYSTLIDTDSNIKFDVGVSDNRVAIFNEYNQIMNTDIPLMNKYIFDLFSFTGTLYNFITTIDDVLQAKRNILAFFYKFLPIYESCSKLYIDIETYITGNNTNVENSFSVLTYLDTMVSHYISASKLHDILYTQYHVISDKLGIKQEYREFYNTITNISSNYIIGPKPELKNLINRIKNIVTLTTTGNTGNGGNSVNVIDPNNIMYTTNPSTSNTTYSGIWLGYKPLDLFTQQYNSWYSLINIPKSFDPSPSVETNHIGDIFTFGLTNYYPPKTTFTFTTTVMVSDMSVELDMADIYINIIDMFLDKVTFKNKILPSITSILHSVIDIICIYFSNYINYDTQLNNNNNGKILLKNNLDTLKEKLNNNLNTIKITSNEIPNYTSSFLKQYLYTLGDITFIDSLKSLNIESIVNDFYNIFLDISKIASSKNIQYGSVTVVGYNNTIRDIYRGYISPINFAIDDSINVYSKESVVLSLISYMYLLENESSKIMDYIKYEEQDQIIFKNYFKTRLLFLERNMIKISKLCNILNFKSICVNRSLYFTDTSIKQITEPTGTFADNLYIKTLLTSINIQNTQQYDKPKYNDLIVYNYFYKSDYENHNKMILLYDDAMVDFQKQLNFSNEILKYNINKGKSIIIQNVSNSLNTILTSTTLNIELLNIMLEIINTEYMGNLEINDSYFIKNLNIGVIDNIGSTGNTGN